MFAPSAHPLQTATYQPQTVSILNNTATSNFVPAFHFQQGGGASLNFMHAVQHHVPNMRPKVTWRSEYIQVPKTIQVPQMIKQPQVIQVPKEIFETKMIAIQVPRIVQVPEEYEVDKTITVPKVIQEEREIRIPVPQMVKKTIRVPKQRVITEHEEVSLLASSALIGFDSMSCLDCCRLFLMISTLLPSMRWRSIKSRRQPPLNTLPRIRPDIRTSGFRTSGIRRRPIRRSRATQQARPPINLPARRRLLINKIPMIRVGQTGNWTFNEIHE
jgi:hypothetical protein